MKIESKWNKISRRRVFGIVGKCSMWGFLTMRKAQEMLTELKKKRKVK